MIFPKMHIFFTLEPQRSWWILITHTAYVSRVATIVFIISSPQRFQDAGKIATQISFPHLCGISSPPSTAPFMTAKTRFPVVVRVSPTSRKHRNGRGPLPMASTLYSSPVGLLTPSYLSPRLNFAKILREKRSEEEESSTEQRRREYRG